MDARYLFIVCEVFRPTVLLGPTELVCWRVGRQSRHGTARSASQSTQKQALNALVSLFQEAFGRHLPEIPFQRAAPGRKIPTVLTRREMTGLFRRLDGRTKLMAELAYGAGLRLMALLQTGAGGALAAGS